MIGISKPIPVYINYQQKSIVAGVLDSEQVFCKTVQSKQRLLCFDAYGLDLEYVEKLRALGCRTIELKERDTGKTFRVSFDLFWKKAIRRSIGHFGTRLYLPLKEWEDPSTPQPDKPTFPAIPQLGLFDTPCKGGEMK